MPTNTYDLIVLGDEFSGLVAATLVARQGPRVLLVVSGTPDTYHIGPYTLPTQTLPFVGIDSGAINLVLDNMHFQHTLRRKLGPDEPSFQFALPKARLDIWSNDEAFARELSRESDAAELLSSAASEAAKLSELLDPLFAQGIGVPPTGFFEKREVGRVEDALAMRAEVWWQGVQQHPLGRALFATPAALGGRCIADASTAVANLRAFDLWRRGAPRLQGDWQTLRETFLDKFDSHGGDVRIATASSISFGWGGKATGLILDDGEEIGAGHIIAAVPIGELEALCGKHGKKLQALSDQVELAGHRYVLNLVIDESGVPEGMGRTVMYVGDPDGELSGANALLINVSEPNDKALVAVTASAVCPLRPEQSTERAFADLRAHMRETLEGIMPFVTDHVVMAHSPHERLPAEGIEGEFGLDEPLPPQPVWRYRGDRSLGISGLPYSVGLKNLTLCSGQILPGLGLEAEFAIGWQAAKQLLGAGKKKSYLGSPVLAADS